MSLEQKIMETDDRLAIREIVDAYAYCADTRDAQEQMALFTEDTIFEVYYQPKSGKPSQTFTGRSGLFPVFDNLNRYDATMHFNGQSTIQLNGLTATGITYCMAHHLSLEEGKQKFMIAAIRYEDSFVKRENKWLFAKRRLMVDWIEHR